MKKPTNYWAKFEENNTYHIYNRGINGVKIFEKEKNYHFFLQKWKTLISPFFEIGAYCLIPNHFHFLVWVKPMDATITEIIRQQGTSKSGKLIQRSITYNEFLEDQFKRLFSSYALALNKQENRTGSLLQKRFKRVLIKDEFKLWRNLIYIHHNPIHHHFAKRYGVYKFCSYQAFLTDNPTTLARDKVLSWFDEDKIKAQAAFVKFHQQFRLDKKEDLYLDDV